MFTVQMIRKYSSPVTAKQEIDILSHDSKMFRLAVDSMHYLPRRVKKSSGKNSLVPIIACIILTFGPESMEGGTGDIGAKIDIEVAHEIGIQKGNLLGFLTFLQCMTTNFSRRRYGLFELPVSILIDSEFMNVEVD